MSAVIKHSGRCEMNRNMVSRVGKNIRRDKVNDCSDFIISILLTETVGERQDESNDTRDEMRDKNQQTAKKINKNNDVPFGI